MARVYPGLMPWHMARFKRPELQALLRDYDQMRSANQDG